MSLSRFAPAPTGFLHLGHVVNAIYVWGLARRRGARVLLRIEDHDAQRARPEFERALLDDLDWLGFVPDLYPTDAFRRGTCLSRQSDRHHIYADVAATLQGRGLLYGCTCTRQALARASHTPSESCPGRCDVKGAPPGDGVVWRVRLPPGVEVFDDLLCGREQQPSGANPAIRDRLGNWTYTFAVCVDDWMQDVDLVVRGRDLLDATGLQMALARLLGRPVPPLFAHHPLVMKSPTQKLSKSDRDTGIGSLRDQGWRPDRVIGEAAAAAGLAPPGARVDARHVADLLGQT